MQDHWQRSFTVFQVAEAQLDSLKSWYGSAKVTQCDSGPGRPCARASLAMVDPWQAPGQGQEGPGPSYGVCQPDS